MSFVEQERALFDLLFDSSLREDFCQSVTAALADYDLSAAEVADFKVVRLDAINVDAAMRAHLMLSYVCQQLPMTFSLVAYVGGGIALLKRLINPQTMGCPFAERVAVFGSQLGESLNRLQFANEKQRRVVAAVLETELGIRRVATMLREQVLEEGTGVDVSAGTIDADWQDKPVRLADYVSVSLLPQSYAVLKDLLCPCVDTTLWRNLNKSGPSLVAEQVFVDELPKLFMARAYVRRYSRIEPLIDHHTVELHEGFAVLLDHLNGSHSIRWILQQMTVIGTPITILSMIENGFQQLLVHNILEFT